MPITVEERTTLALSALAEITDPADVGDLLGVDEVEPGVVDLRFACRLAAYRDWHWTVSTSDLPDVTPTVLEVELLPGEGSLLAPPWVPWAERLAEWRRSHAEGDEQGDDESDDEDDDLDDESDDGDADEDDELDEDDLGGDVLDQGVDVEDAVDADDEDDSDDEDDEDERDEGLREP